LGGAVVCFVGCDGSGKTTVARLIAARLRAGGLRVRLAWMRGSHLLASLLGRLLSRFRTLQGSDNPYYKIASSRLGRVWRFIEAASAIPVWLARYVAWALAGYVVVGDRGMLDAVVWIAMTTNGTRFLNELLGRAMLRMAARCINIYVRADLGILASRRPGEDLGRLARQLALYDVLSRAVGAYVIDTGYLGPSEALRAALEVLGREGR